MIDTKNKKSAGRPRNFDREEALEAALSVLWSKGYEGASISNLTEVMGINSPSLYAAFGSKAGLYKEVLDLYISNQGARILSPLLLPIPAKQAIKEMLFFAAKEFTNKNNPPGCLIASGTLRCKEESSEAAQLTFEHRQNSYKVILKCLKNAKENSELSKDVDTTEMATYFTGIIQGMSVLAIDGAGLKELNKMCDLAMKIWP